MIDKSGIIEQTNLAFDFIQKLHLEVSYLIKEVEAMLSEEEESFIIGKPSGYGISTRSSTGLETNNVSLWVMRRFAVCFIPEAQTKIAGGQSVTELHDELRILYLRFVLNGKNVTEPAVYSGVLRDIKTGPRGQKVKKFESFMGHFEYVNDRLFENREDINYEDGTLSIKGELAKVNLYDVNNSEAIRTKIVEPSLALYREGASD